jgi:quercetin dioxygenase-like cupin family protein
MNEKKSETIRKDLISKPLNLAKLIEYQEGSVVSRTIINKKDATVTLFAFDTGQCLSEHTAPFEAMIYVLEGEADVIISGKSNMVTEGEMIIMPANIPHAVKANIDLKMLLLMMKS